MDIHYRQEFGAPPRGSDLGWGSEPEPQHRPAVMVSLGAGASLVGLLGAFPQLIWLSEHKECVFMVAVVMLLVAGQLLSRARMAPCPADPKLAMACQRLRRWSVVLYAISVVGTFTGFLFAFVLPALLS